MLGALHVAEHVELLGQSVELGPPHARVAQAAAEGRAAAASGAEVGDLGQGDSWTGLSVRVGQPAMR